jgi:hypothetical protein
MGLLQNHSKNDLTLNLSDPALVHELSHQTTAPIHRKA